jgi:hypothetical protein
MKKLVFTSVFFALSTLFMALSPLETSKDQLRDQIIQLLETPNIQLETEELNAVIIFTLNGKGEVVVLSVETDSSYLEGYVKEKLNYKKVAYAQLIPGEKFKMNLRVVR